MGSLETEKESASSENLFKNYYRSKSLGILIHESIDEEKLLEFQQSLLSCFHALETNLAYPFNIGRNSLERELENEDGSLSNGGKVLILHKKRDEKMITPINHVGKNLLKFIYQNFTPEHYRIQKLERGTVIDHLQPGTAEEIYMKLLMKNYGKEVCLWASYVPSTKYGSKDIIKLANVFVSPREASAIALLSPKTQPVLNFIEDYKVQVKQLITLHSLLEGVADCKNGNCISRSAEFKTKGRPSVLVSYKDENKITRVSCKYCGFDYGYGR